MKISLNQYTILLLAASLPLSSALDEHIRVADDDFGNGFGMNVPVLGRDDDFLQVPDLKVKVKKAMDNCKVYKMDFANFDFTEIRKTYDTTPYPGLGDPEIGARDGMNWGLHALQWKAYKHFDKGGTYDKGLAHSSNPPAWDNGGGNHVSNDDADRLDFLERADSGIFKDSAGNPTDPIGTWVSAEEPDAYAAAVMAAMNIEYWTTPTYVDTKDGGVAVIEKVKLCIDGGPPHVVCGWEPRGSYASTCGQDNLVFEEIEVARFDGDGNYKDIRQPGYNILNSDQWEAIYGKNDGTMPVLVFDPPAGTSRAEIEALKEQAENIVIDSLIDPAVVTEIINDANTGGSIRGGNGGWN